MAGAVVAGAVVGVAVVDGVGSVAGTVVGAAVVVVQLGGSVTTGIVVEVVVLDELVVGGTVDVVVEVVDVVDVVVESFGFGFGLASPTRQTGRLLSSQLLRDAEASTVADSSDEPSNTALPATVNTSTSRLIG